MKKRRTFLPDAPVLAILFCVSGTWQGRGQALLYEETFPHAGIGDVPITTVGWNNDIPSQPNRLFPIGAVGNGAVYAFQNNGEVPISTAFYTTSALDDGTVGMAFPAIALAAHSGLTVSVDIRATYDPDHMESRFAIQLNGADWYASATVLPVPDTQEAFFRSYSMGIDPDASAWQAFSLLGTEVSMGGIATADLTGTVTGAGLVVTHSLDSGTHDFDDFRITADVGKLVVTEIGQSELTVAWTGASNVRLQATRQLVPAVWTDVSNTLGEAMAMVSTSPSTEYLRLSSRPGAVPDPSNPIGNPGFDFDGTPVPVPSGWTTTGDANAAAVVADGAMSTGFSLQHTGDVPYQVTTAQQVTHLTNGIYRLTAKVKSSGGQEACFLSGNGRRTSLAALDTEWTDLVVRGIEVTNQQCAVQIVSAGPSGTWCRVDSLSLVRDDIPYLFLKGGDVSEVPRMEYYGGQFVDDGVTNDPLRIMNDHGCNLARIRLYNDPGNTNFYPSSEFDPLGWMNPSNTLALCQRVKDAGMQTLLTFHYSDYWTNPGQQIKPHHWDGLSFPDLTNAVYTFTREFMLELAAQGTLPEYVSIGNEINGGMLFPDGANSSSAGWNRLAMLLDNGYRAVKAVSPATQVIIHIGTVDGGVASSFFGNLVSRNVPFDILGCSYYPYWTGLTTAQARDEINQWAPPFNKPLLIMETGYNWHPTTCDGTPGQLTTNGPETYPSTPQGQKDFLLKCFKDLKLVDDGICIGDVYWDPVFTCVPGQGWKNGARNVVANTALFDFIGNALPAFDAFEFND